MARPLPDLGNTRSDVRGRRRRLHHRLVLRHRVQRLLQRDLERAVVAFLVEEDFHGLGIARRLLQHLGRIAIDRGVLRFEAEVLPYNSAMLKVFAASGWPMSKRHDDGAIHITLTLAGATAS